MALSHQGVYVQTPRVEPLSFVNADGTTKKTVFTAGADGSKVVGISAGSNDTSARVVLLWLLRGGSAYQLNAQTVAITAGTDGVTVAQNLMASWAALPVDNDGQRYLFLKSGDAIQASMGTAVTAAKQVDVIVVAADF